LLLLLCLYVCAFPVEYFSTTVKIHYNNYDTMMSHTHAPIGLTMTIT